MNIPQKTFTLDELTYYNGRNGHPAYIAYNNIVYDVTRSFHWQGGRHQVLHDAGQVLIFDDAPHGPDLLERVPVIGRLITEK